MPDESDSQEKRLLEAIAADPADETAKVRYEEFLAQTRPDSVERHLLRLERELAAVHADPSCFDRLLEDYIAFKTRHSTYFWDWHRGRRDPLFRFFKLWLVSVSDARRFAVEQAISLRYGTSAALDHLPAVIVASAPPDVARSEREKITDFVRRYRGPTGQEPELRSDELALAITPSWVNSPT